MILSDRTILDRLWDCIKPFDHRMVQPASIDVRLGPKFRVFENHTQEFIDPREDQSDLLREVEVARGGHFVLHPGQFVLGVSFERFEIPTDLAARVEGKSSLGRLGLHVHATAGFVDPGFQGYLTFEMTLHAPLPLRLYPGMKIGQVAFMKLDQPAQVSYGHEALESRYQGQEGPTASRGHRNFHQSDVWPAPVPEPSLWEDVGADDVPF